MICHEEDQCISVPVAVILLGLHVVLAVSPLCVGCKLLQGVPEWEGGFSPLLLLLLPQIWYRLAPLLQLNLVEQNHMLLVSGGVLILALLLCWQSP